VNSDLDLWFIPAIDSQKAVGAGQSDDAAGRKIKSLRLDCLNRPFQGIIAQ
jgi:hypothetical protein